LAQAHPDWVLGFQDETWWSRLALPALHAWSDGEPLRLVEQATDRTDPDPKALCCYGLLRADTGGMLLRFVRGRPVSQVTEDFLVWLCQRLAAEGKTALLLVWDNASWHISQRVRAWIKAHNRQAKGDGGVRLVACRLPSKSPWLNPIEPKWAHGKKAIAAQRLLLLAARAVPFFGAPAAQGWARTAVESRIRTSRSGSRKAARIGSQRPCLAQRSKRRHGLLPLPSRSGRSARAAPVRAIHKTASRKRRLSRATPPCWPGWPGSRCWIRSQSASESAWRGSMVGPP
jgi:hypothetical protein